MVLASAHHRTKSPDLRQHEKRGRRRNKYLADYPDVAEDLAQFFAQDDRIDSFVSRWRAPPGSLGNSKKTTLNTLLVAAKRNSTDACEQNYLIEMRGFRSGCGVPW